MNWKKIAFGCFNVVLGAYVILAMTAFNKPDDTEACREVSIHIEKDMVEGFLSVADVKRMLEADGLNPVGMNMERLDLRAIEETLQAKELIEAAECYKCRNGVVRIDIRQRIPVVRVMNNSGDDFYVDSHGVPMPRTDYSCNIIVATGNASRQYAGKYLAPLAASILRDAFWKNQVVQLHVLQDGAVEMVPRVGEHIVSLGQPVGIGRKLDRLRKFYRYGLNVTGWNKYSRISVEFDNQIVCKRK